MSKPWNLRFMEYIGFSVKSDSILLPLFRSSPTPTRKPTRQISQCCIVCLGTSEPPLWMDILGTCTEPPPLGYGFMQASPCMFALVHHVAQHHKGSGDARLESECDLSRDGSTHLR